jgi:hypothetical protein
MLHTKRLMMRLTQIATYESAKDAEEEAANEMYNTGIARQMFCAVSY